MCPLPLYIHPTCFYIFSYRIFMDFKRWNFYFSLHATLQWYSLCPGHYPKVRESWICITWNTSLPRVPFCCCIRIWLKQSMTHTLNLLRKEEKFWAFQLSQSVFLQICVFNFYLPGNVQLLTDLSHKLQHRSYESEISVLSRNSSTAFHPVSQSHVYPSEEPRTYPKALHFFA